MMRTLVPILAAAVILTCACSPEADGPTGSFDDLYALTGQTPAACGLWDTEPLASRLVELLGARREAFLGAMADADPIAEHDGVLYVTGRRADDTGMQAAALRIDPANDHLQAQLRINRVAQDFTEGGDPRPWSDEVQAFLREFEVELYARAGQEAPPPATPTDKAAMPAPAAGGKIHRGYLVVGPQVVEFLTCATQQTAYVENRSQDDLNAIREYIEIEPYRPMFAEVRGVLGAAQPNEVRDGFELRLVLTEIRRVYPTHSDPRCAESRDFAYRVWGTDPAWSVTIRESGIAAATADAPDARFPYAAPLRSGDRLRYVATAEDGTRLEVELQARRCRDPETGAFFSLGAAARIGAKTFNGCAYRGE